MKDLFRSIKILGALTVLCGVLYPLMVTLVAQTTFSDRANGSLVVREGRVVGSTLISQKTTEPGYFWPRPSAIDYNPLPSGGSNLSPASSALKTAVAERRQKIPEAQPEMPVVPSDILLASASGLDPEISLAAAHYQASRVAGARGLPLQRVMSLIDEAQASRQFGLLGEPRINVLKLNLALDEAGVAKAK